ncbi:serine hydrolase domain-containing protein, partial [Enterobacter roggenkampii]|uniref:serine hydrolase domain-containing protein n=1 Tax=Enterobacter roggenkampii TaxID=1812935 RepID=UPI003B844598
DTNNLANNLKVDISPTYFNPPSAKMSIEEFLNNILNPSGKWYSKENFSENKPGQIYDYTNVGATLAALVVENATEIPYDKFTTQYILDPLEMTASGWDFNTIDFSNYTQPFQNKTTAYPYYTLNSYPDGGMLTTSRDMSKYICELLKGFAGNGTLLSKTSYKEYFMPQLKAENFIDRDTSPYSDEYNTGIN